MKNVGNSSRGRSQGVMNIFRAPYRAHCAVIFATAQLSCLRFFLKIQKNVTFYVFLLYFTRFLELSQYGCNEYWGFFSSFNI